MSESGLPDLSRIKKVRETDDVVSTLCKHNGRGGSSARTRTRHVHYNPEFDCLSSEPMLDACSINPHQHLATVARFPTFILRRRTRQGRQFQELNAPVGSVAVCASGIPACCELSTINR
jgi:hypothetical protein